MIYHSIIMTCQITFAKKSIILSRCIESRLELLREIVIYILLEHLLFKYHYAFNLGKVILLNQ